MNPAPFFVACLLLSCCCRGNQVCAVKPTAGTWIHLAPCNALIRKLSQQWAWLHFALPLTYFETDISVGGNEGRNDLGLIHEKSTAVHALTGDKVPALAVNNQVKAIRLSWVVTPDHQENRPLSAGAY